MQVCVALEQRFRRLPDGSVWTNAQFGRPFWRRYLDVFDHVCCLARVETVPTIPDEWQRADGPGVSFSPVPHYVGPAQLLRRLTQVRAAVRGAIRPGDAFVLRVPGALGSLAWRQLQASRYPYGVEVIGDPFDVFAPGAVRHPLRRPLRWYSTRQLRAQCRSACAASYVTAEALQRRYPTSRPAIAASSIELGEDMFAAAPRSFVPAPQPARLVFVGSLEQYYKAPDVVIRALARVAARGLDVQLTIIGDGRCRQELEALAAEERCAHRVRFAGHLATRAAVVAELDAADLFVLPSRTEGLPRAMVEAMARALPCLGSTAGGIPELLPDEALVAPGDVGALAGRIVSVLQDPAWMRRMSARNLEHARAYRHAVLQQRRVAFYRAVEAATAAWMRSGRIVA